MNEELHEQTTDEQVVVDNQVSEEEVITDDWEDKYKRSLADYQNLLKQTAKEKVETIKYANADLLTDLLPVYSHLKTVVNGATGQDAWLEGVKFVVKQFKEVLTAAGVEEILTQGQAFNHDTMEALSEELTTDDSLDGQVAQEAMAGYKLNGRVIMPAKVKVYKIDHN